MVKLYEDLDLNGNNLLNFTLSLSGDLSLDGYDILDVNQVSGDNGYIDLDASSGNIRIRPTNSGVLLLSGEMQLDGYLDVEDWVWIYDDLDVQGDIYCYSDIMADGDIAAAGDIIGDHKYFRIDHPIYPDEKYLFHCAVESSERRTVYYGRATTVNGSVIVSFPEWWSALNGTNKDEFNYQVTPIGKKAICWIGSEIEDGSFEICSDIDCTLSWQVTAIRHDTSSENNPFNVEVDKEYIENI